MNKILIEVKELQLLIDRLPKGQDLLCSEIEYKGYVERQKETQFNAIDNRPFSISFKKVKTKNGELSYALEVLTEEIDILKRKETKQLSLQDDIMLISLKSQLRIKTVEYNSYKDWDITHETKKTLYTLSNIISEIEDQIKQIEND